jgi:5-oxoprolinase (ATP-hydrolysing)
VADFEAAYRQRFAFLMPGRALVIEAVSVEAVAAGVSAMHAPAAAAAAPVPPRPAPDATVRMHSGQWLTRAACARVAAARRHHRRPGHHCRAERHHGGRARLAGRADRRRCHRTAACAPRATQHAIGTEADPVMLEVFNNLFMNIAEQMGLRLQNTAYSVNIKERLDFSCALFSAEGELIANAPHMPVHLGSMSESIKTVIARNPACSRAMCMCSTTRTTAARTCPT